MSDIRLDQRVIVYEYSAIVYEGLWKDAPDDILDANGDWYLLANVENADVVFIINNNID